jgi:SNF2 family DNA or RNA helicase
VQLRVERSAIVEVKDERLYVLSAEQLLHIEEFLEKELSMLQLSPSLWSISFEYSFEENRKPELNLLLVLKNGTKVFKTPMPTEIESDYLLVQDWILPIRHADLKALRELIPMVHRDDELDLSISELLSFDYFASKNEIFVSNSEVKERFLANPRFDISAIKHGLEIDPYPYQAVGIEWLCTQQMLGRRGTILADVMGLGKTLQAIGLITKNIEDGFRSNLIVCPGTLIENWRREFEKFSPKVVPYVHSGPNRAGTIRRLEGHDVVITSYENLVGDHSLLNQINWNVVILDEAQAIKNPRAKRTRRAKSLPRSFGVVISGTPLENRLVDLWSLAEFADDSIFGTEAHFEANYEGSIEGARQVNQKISPIMLRRRLTDIEHQLPEKVVIEHPLRWPSELVDVYERVRLEAIEEFKSAGPLVATGRLRKLATHPFLMDIGPGDLMELSPKYSLTIEIIDELFESGEKALIFSSYTKMIEGLSDGIELRHPHALVEILNGETPIGERQQLVERFNAFNGPGVLICNPIVAGAGLNITGANHVIHYNLEWNPAKEDQATFRVFRNGQTKQTFIHRLFYVDTIDEAIDDRIRMKRELSDVGVDAVLTREDLLAALQVSPQGKTYE